VNNHGETIRHTCNRLLAISELRDTVTLFIREGRVTTINRFYTKKEADISKHNELDHFSTNFDQTLREIILKLFLVIKYSGSHASH